MAQNDMEVIMYTFTRGGKQDRIKHKLGVTVWAPDKLGIINKFANRYRVYSGSEKGVEDGTFVPFTPNNRKEAVK